MSEASAELHCHESEELDSIASDDEESQQAAFSQANPDAPVREVRLELGMEFENLDHFKKAVKKFNINIGRIIFFSRVDSTRCKAICYDESCPWQIYCAKWSYPLSFQVKTFVNEHTCSRVNKNKSADDKWVVEELEKKIRDHPDMTQRQSQDFFKKEYDVIVNERKIYRAMMKAKELIEGSEIAQYAVLRDYANEIMRTNPGSTVRIRLDGTFLKGYYPDQLLTAIGHDANNHIYPISYAVVECECKDSWEWFLELLQEDLGDAAINVINFMSDMQKLLSFIGYNHIVALLFSTRASSLLCMRTLENSRGDIELNMAMWRCAKATTSQEFNAVLDRIKRVNPHTWEYPNRILPSQWSRSSFSEYPKSDNYTNNN
ncbi:uncharacterized protein [Arachis hypogaea]|uniref:uncharacterized protein n=1 Tax=Arachis hypogaea TaxID=3818 RepID=UPI000DEDB182|nr:uncharacterized protein LOC112785633 [Arachis hypogaea]